MTPSYLGSAAVSKSYLGGAQASSIALGQGGGGQAPSGYGFLQVGNSSSYSTLRVGSDSSAPRILIPTGA